MSSRGDGDGERGQEMENGNNARENLLNQSQNLMNLSRVSSLPKTGFN